MSESPFEQYPNAPGHMDEVAFDPIGLMRTIEERTANISQFFRTEIGAFSLLQAVAHEQEKKVNAVHVRTNEEGVWRFYPAVDYNPDFADSSKRRILGITIHTHISGDNYPRLSVRTEPNQDPVENYARYELLIATAALRGQLLRLPDNTEVIAPLMGPPSAATEVILNRQRRYVTWVKRAAVAVGIPLTRQLYTFAPAAPPHTN